MLKLRKLLANAKAQAKVIFTGLQLLVTETKSCILLKQRIQVENYIPNRNELLKIHRNRLDLRKLIPFLVISVVLPEIIPVILMRGSTMVPSTCITEQQKLALLNAMSKKRMLISSDLKEIGFKEWNQLKWPMLRKLSTFHGLSSIRLPFTLRRNLAIHADFLKRDNEMICVESMSDEEVLEALEHRGINHFQVENKTQLLLDIINAQNGKTDVQLLTLPISTFAHGPEISCTKFTDSKLN